MLWVLLVVAIAVFEIGSWLYHFDIIDDLGLGMQIVSVLAVIVILATSLIFGVIVSKHTVIDEKIAMYQEENASIERQVAVVVEDYMIHENVMYDKAKVESPIVLAQMYPELKSNELCQRLIDIYVENNETLKSLKESKIDGSVYRWWLYFGR